MTCAAEILATVPGEPLSGLRRVDQLWQALRSGNWAVPQLVQTCSSALDTVDRDVVICGGTLGIFLGAVLVQQGWRVALIERGLLRGRDQEWNISRTELQVFLELGLLTEAELATAIASEYNPVRLQFLGGPTFWVRDVLNVGVDPVFLLDKLKAEFLAAGGQLWEHSQFTGAIVHPNGVAVQLQTNSSNALDACISEQVTTRLLVDGMGHFSPIARQARQGQTPDAICLVVGTCAQGFAENTTGDLMVTFTPIAHQCQYFWEAFPARDGRTTYMFTYLDAHPDRPSLEFLFDEYFRLLPDYQQVSISALTFKRALFGLFPCYQASPLTPQWSRVLHIGDSSGNQSPLSFGGFGAMIRHLPRLADGIKEALTIDALRRSDLAALQPYQPNLSVTWLFQRTMSVGVNQKVAPNQINELLSAVFAAMDQAGDQVLRPFLQDVVQFPALTEALLRTALQHPAVVARLLPQVGPGPLLHWGAHYASLAAYTVLDGLVGAIAQADISSLPLTPRQRYHWHRWQQAWHYGAGRDFHQGSASAAEDNHGSD